MLDIEILKSIKKTLVNLKSTGLDRSAYLDLIKNLAGYFNGLKWDNSDVDLIRNKFGKINYARGGRTNGNYIDFICFSRLGALIENDTYAPAVMTMLDRSHQQLDCLSRNIIALIQLTEGNVESIQLESLTSLEGSIDFFHDRILLDKMHQALLDVGKITTELSRTRDAEFSVLTRYGAARVITILGEAFKGFSDGFNRRFPYLRSREFVKMRNVLGHSHRRLVRDADEALTQNYKQLLSRGVPELSEYVRQVAVCLEAGFKVYKQSAKKQEIISSYSSESAKIYLKKYWPSTLDLTPENLMAKGFDEKIKSKFQYSAHYYLLRHMAENKGKQPLIRSVEKFGRKGAKLEKKIKKMKELKKLLDDKTKKGGKLTEEEIGRYKQYGQTISMQEGRLKKILARKNAKLSVVKPIERPAVKSGAPLVPADVMLDSVMVLSGRLNTLSKSASKPPKKLVKIPEQTKIYLLMDNLNAEHKIIRAFKVSGQASSQRHYAIEHAVSAIGQIFRDIDGLHSSFLASMSNSFVSRHMRETIKVRNKDIMHSPFDTTFQQIDEHVETSIFTTTKDYQALASLTKASLNNDMSKNLVDRAGHLNNYASDFLRLGHVDSALLFVKQAIDFLTPSSLAEETLGAPLLHNTLLFVLDETLHLKRYQAYSNAGHILKAKAFREVGEQAGGFNMATSASYKLAYEYFKEAYSIYKKNPGIVALKAFSAEAVLAYIKLAIKLHPMQHSRESFSKELKILEAYFSKEYLSVERALMQPDYKVAYDELMVRNMDDFKGELKFVYANHLLTCYCCLVTDDRSYTVINAAIKHAQVYDKLLHLTKNQEEGGVLYSHYFEMFHRSLVHVISAFEHAFLKLATTLLEKSVSTLASTAFALAQRNGVSTKHLQFNLGIFYGNKYTRNARSASFNSMSETSKRLQDQAFQYLDVTIQGDILGIKIKACFAKAFVYEANKQYPSAVNLLLEGLSLFERLPSSEKASFESDEQPEAVTALRECVNACNSVDQQSYCVNKIESLLGKVTQLEKNNNTKGALDVQRQLCLLLARVSGGVQKKFAPSNLHKRHKKGWLKKRANAKLASLVKTYLSALAQIPDEPVVAYVPSPASSALLEASKIMAKYTKQKPGAQATSSKKVVLLSTPSFFADSNESKQNFKGNVLSKDPVASCSYNP